jgi:hypothetical protein
MYICYANLILKQQSIMRKFYFLFLTLLTVSLSFGQASDLYFSMYGEGSSNNKFLEIYNGTGAPVDLSNYSLSSCSNGCDIANEFDFPDTFTFTAGTMLADGAVYVIAHPSANQTILDASDATFTFLSNGNDAFALTLAGATADTYTIIDMLGDLSDVNVSGWEVAGVSNGTVNHTLTRKSSVCDPNPVQLGSFGTDASNSEWVVGAEDSGWDQLGMYTGCISDPVLTITAPSNGAEFPSGTTNVDVTIDVQNFVIGNPGAGIDGHIHWTLNGVNQPMKYDTDPEPISVTNGETYTVFMQLVDNSHTPISPAVEQTVTFSVALPCDIQVGTISTTCDAETAGVDTYTVTIEYTGGGTTTYTIDTEGNGTVGGDNPSNVADGTITITGVDEGTNFTVTFTGDAANSSCDFTRSITSPACVGGVVCGNYGDIIITEIMQNPAAVGDNSGEWFEVYNTTGAPINMQGWVIKDDASSGEEFTISALTVPANDYAVFGINADMGTNGGVPVDYEYSGISLGNGADGLIIECSGTMIDQVIWDGGTDFPDPTGASMELSITAMNADDNDLGANWGEAITPYGDGDFGTPGSQNDFTLSVDSFNRSEFNVYPNPVSNGFLNITSASNEAITVTIYDILGKRVLNSNVENNVLNVSSLNAGIYVLNINQNGNNSTKKLIIK